MIPACFTLRNIRYTSRVKWSNPGKGVVTSSPPRLVAIEKGAFWPPSTTVTNFTNTTEGGFLYCRIILYFSFTSVSLRLYKRSRFRFLRRWSHFLFGKLWCYYIFRSIGLLFSTKVRLLFAYIDTVTHKINYSHFLRCMIHLLEYIYIYIYIYIYNTKTYSPSCIS